MEPDRRWQNLAWSVLAVAVFLWFAHVAQVVFVPTLLAFYLALLVLPLHRGMQARLPARLRWLATLVAVLLPILAVAVVVLVTWWAGQQVAQQAPELRRGLEEAWSRTLAWVEDHGMPVDDVLSGITFERFLDQASRLVRDAVYTTFTVTFGFAIVLFLVALLLSEREEWVAKTREMMSRRGAGDLFAIADVASENVRQFLWWRTVSGLMSAASVGLVTWAMEVPFWPLWALLQWLLNYIPNVGSVIAGVFPVLFAFVLVDATTALWLMVVIFLLEQFIGNFLDPKLQGRGLRLSPAAVMVALLLFGWVWGVVGALLSAPILATIRAISQHVPELAPLATLLGRHPDEEAARGSSAK